MTGPVLVVENLWKAYPVRPPQRVPALLQRFRHGGGDHRHEVDLEDDLDHEDDTELSDDDARTDAPAAVERWALRDVSFSAEPGSIVAITGPSGAGKTTLLRVIGQLTPPTAGRVLVRGHIAPTVELAAALMQGHWPAHKNIMLLGRYLGLPPEDVTRRIEEVVTFAGLERYVDLPLRQYPSGMVQRLYFSAVLNLRPELLLADGRLGVGDRDFRERCLEHICESARQGMAVVFSSQDEQLIDSLAHHVICLEAGAVAAQGPPDEVFAPSHAMAAADEVGAGENAESEADANEVGAGQDDETHADANEPVPPAAIRSIDVLDADGAPGAALSRSEDAEIVLRIDVNERAVTVRISVGLQIPGVHFDKVLNRGVHVENAGSYVIACRLPGRLLPSGRYVARAIVHLLRDGRPIGYRLAKTFHFEVSEVPGGDDGNEQPAPLGELDRAVTWRTEQSAEVPLETRDAR